MKIGIVGNGVVGSALRNLYSDVNTVYEYGFSYLDRDKHKVSVYDADPTRCLNTIDETLQSDLVFVCLPTPQSANGLECNLEYIFDFFTTALSFWADTCYVLKSTVPIGTTKRIQGELSIPNIVHSPEFLTERTAVFDARTPRLNIIGQPDGSGASLCFNLLQELYMTTFPFVRCIRLTSDESEAMKLIENAFFATKITFFNEIRSLCDALHLSWHTILECLCMEGRVGRQHTQVPGPDGKFGFGGKCLPKDTAMLVHEINEKAGKECPRLLERVLEVNKFYRGE